MPGTKFDVQDPFEYLAGFNNYHQSEAIPGTLPFAQNLPQRLAKGLYPERISGTSFTSPRKDNKQTWLYRILPSTCHDSYVELNDHPLNVAQTKRSPPLNYGPNPNTWAPVTITPEDNFVTGLRQIGGAGDPKIRQGVAYYAYTAGKSMSEKQAFFSADGDFCVVPQTGVLDIRTEIGNIRVRPSEICVIPRGIRYSVSLPNGPVRGFVLECYSGHFDLPELGPIGSYGLANVIDFEVPKASYLNSDDESEVLAKFAGKIHRTTHRGSIFNVVAWRGNYYPFKYDLGKFNTIGSISFDHPDPSIFTVLTCPSEKPGEAAADVVVFSPRWLVMEKSFRPPYYHRNTMSEFAFLIKGGFDVKPLPPAFAGMFNLANTLTDHGPDAASFEEATTKDLKPEKIDENNLGMMFESCFMIGTTQWADEEAQKFPSRAEGYVNLRKASL